MWTPHVCETFSFTAFVSVFVLSRSVEFFTVRSTVEGFMCCSKRLWVLIMILPYCMLLRCELQVGWYLQILKIFCIILLFCWQKHMESWNKDGVSLLKHDFVVLKILRFLAVWRSLSFCYQLYCFLFLSAVHCFLISLCCFLSCCCCILLLRLMFRIVKHLVPEERMIRLNPFKVGLEKQYVNCYIPLASIVCDLCLLRLRSKHWWWWRCIVLNAIKRFQHF